MNADKLTPDALRGVHAAQKLPNDPGLHRHGREFDAVVADLPMPEVLWKKPGG